MGENKKKINNMAGVNWYVGIVLYNPDILRLKQNIAGLLAFCGGRRIILLDNASANKAEVKALWGGHKDFIWIENPINMGVATAINQIMNQVEALGGEWCLTMDQDSVSEKGLVEEYLKYIAPDIGVLTCRIKDRNFGWMYSSECNGSEEVRFCITSGSFISVRAWKTVGGFNDDLFIDGVDFDFCFRIRAAGFSVLRLNGTFLLHEVGYARKVRLLGHEAMILNHSSLRLYYIARNYLYIGFTYGEFWHWAFEVFKRFVLVVLYEKGKLSKIKYMFKGICHAYMGRLGKY